MPALQRIYRALAAVRCGGPALESLHTDLVESEDAGRPLQVGTGTGGREPIRLQKEL